MPEKKSGLEIEDVYLKIKISPNILIALEHDKADTLLDQLYVRKFLKQYAEFLGLDGMAIEKEYTQENNLLKTSEPEPLKVILPKTKKRLFKIPVNLIKKAAIFIFIIVVIFALITLIKNIKPKKGAVILETKEQKTVSVIPADNELTLMISTREKVWIELKSDGEIVMKNFLAADSKENWKAKEYFELSVGKPEAISAWLNGQKLNIPQHKRIRKARIDREGINL